MKFWILPTAIGLALLCSPAVAQPFDESKANIFYELSKPLRKTIVPPQGDVSLDDYIVELSKNSDINFIADVTGRAADEKVGAYPNSAIAREGKWKPTFYAVREDLEEAQRLSELRYDDTTYLLWSKPDGMRTARLIIEAGKNHIVEPLPDESELHRALDNYLRGVMGWSKEEAPQIGDINVKLREFVEANDLEKVLSEKNIEPKLGGLSPALRAQVMKAFQPKLGDLSPALRAQILIVSRKIALKTRLDPAQYFADEFWKTARFRVTVFDSRFSPVMNVAPAPSEGSPPLFARAVIRLQLENELMESDIFPPRLISSPNAEEPREDDLISDIVVAPVATLGDNVPLPLMGDTLRSTQGLTAEQLEAEISLQTPISLEEKRRPLRELLASAGEAHGVKLNVSQSVPTVLVTLRVSKMPLGTLMGALARVYGAYWDSQSSTEFTLHARNLDELQTLMLRAGKGDFLAPEGHEDLVDLFDQPQRQVAQSIGALMSQQQIQSGDNFAVADLPEELQFQLRSHFEQAAATQLTDSYFRAWRWITPELFLRLRRDYNPRTSDWNVELMTSDTAGQLAWTIVHGPPLAYETELQLPQ